MLTIFPCVCLQCQLGCLATDKVFNDDFFGFLPQTFINLRELEIIVRFKNLKQLNFLQIIIYTIKESC